MFSLSLSFLHVSFFKTHPFWLLWAIEFPVCLSLIIWQAFPTLVVFFMFQVTFNAICRYFLTKPKLCSSLMSNVYWSSHFFQLCLLYNYFSLMAKLFSFPKSMSDLLSQKCVNQFPLLTCFSQRRVYIYLKSIFTFVISLVTCLKALKLFA